MSNERVMCSVFRSDKKEGMYLYLPKNASRDELPEALMTTFGELGHVMDLLLTSERKLARANVQDVMTALSEPGYYLQMPPLEGGEGASVIGQQDVNG